MNKKALFLSLGILVLFVAIGFSIESASASHDYNNYNYRNSYGYDSSSYKVFDRGNTYSYYESNGPYGRTTRVKITSGSDFSRRINYPRSDRYIPYYTGYGNSYSVYSPIRYSYTYYPSSYSLYRVNNYWNYGWNPPARIISYRTYSSPYYS